MIKAEDILSMNFYTCGQAFCGSMDGMRYRIIMEKRETCRDGDDKPVFEKYFDTAIWPEPYCYEATDPEKIIHREFPFDETGYMAVLDYLNANIELYGDSTRVYNIKADSVKA